MNREQNLTTPKSQKKPHLLLTFLGLVLICAVISSIYILRIEDRGFTFGGFLLAFVIMIPFHLPIFAMPLLTDAYDFVVPIPATIYMVILLISSTSVSDRILQDSYPDTLSIYFS